MRILDEDYEVWMRILGKDYEGWTRILGEDIGRGYWARIDLPFRLQPRLLRGILSFHHKFHPFFVLKRIHT